MIAADGSMAITAFALIVSDIWSVTGAQLPLVLEAVTVKVTTPVSPIPGVYVGVSVLPLVMLPVPLWAQDTVVPADVVAPVDCDEKLKATPSHVCSSLPAFTVGAL
jgi:hypothetical protein